MEITGISEGRNIKYEALKIKTQISSGGGGSVFQALQRVRILVLPLLFEYFKSYNFA